MIKEYCDKCKKEITKETGRVWYCDEKMVLCISCSNAFMKEINKESDKLLSKVLFIDYAMRNIDFNKVKNFLSKR